MLIERTIDVFTQMFVDNFEQFKINFKIIKTQEECSPPVKVSLKIPFCFAWGTPTSIAVHAFRTRYRIDNAHTNY